MIDTHSGRLAGKTALITGAASVRGIGFATARRFAREGCAVYLADLDAAPLAERAAEITAAGGGQPRLPSMFPMKCNGGMPSPASMDSTFW